VLDILTGVLSGGGFSTHVRSLYKEVAEPSHVAHVCAALRIESFMPLPEFQARMEAILGLVHSCPRAAGVDRVWVPGEIEHETESLRRTSGIPLPSELVGELRGLGGELEVSPPF